MSETPLGHRPLSEVLNVSEELIIEICPTIGWTLPELKTYANKMKENDPELSRHAGRWVYQIRNHLDVNLAKRAERAFNTGNLMMYELIVRAGQEAGLTVPKQEFPDDGTMDTEPLVSEAQLLIDLSLRGMHLPKDYPVFFKAATSMLAGCTGEEPQDIRQSFFESPVYDGRNFDMIYYLAGTAEVVLPIEKCAQVIALKTSWTA